MISKASAIQHGQAMTNYATKNNRADIVKTNHLSEGLPPMGMWDEMVLHQSMSSRGMSRNPSNWPPYVLNFPRLRKKHETGIWMIGKDALMSSSMR